MVSKKKIFASVLAAALLVVGLSGTENNAAISETSAGWTSPQGIQSSNLLSADFNSQIATNFNSRSSEFMVTDAVFPKFRSDITWWGWSNNNPERVSHIALRRHPDMPRSDVTIHVDSVNVASRWAGSEDFARNFSWQLYNLRGYSGNWSACSTGNIGAIRAYGGGSLLMATGNTMTGRTLHNSGSVNNNLVNANNTDRDANLCLIVTEKTGTDYRFSNLGRCMYFEFNINMTTRVTGASTAWRQPFTITTEMLNMAHPNRYTPQNCAAG